MQEFLSSQSKSVNTAMSSKVATILCSLSTETGAMCELRIRDDFAASRNPSPAKHGANCLGLIC